MKTLFKYLIFFLIIAIGIYFIIVPPVKDISKIEGIRVLLVYNPILKKKYQYILDAYKSVLEEEGVPMEFVTPTFLLTQKISDVVEKFPVIIYPDYAAQILPTDIYLWMRDYLQQGGNMALIFDAGTKHMSNNFNNKTIFADLLDLNYITYNIMEDSNLSYTTGFFKFKDKAAVDFFQIPPGKTSNDFYLMGYHYGKLQFPFARVETDKSLDKKNIYAYGIDENDKEFPLILLKKVEKGSLLYVNLPLGHLKANADDLLIRSILRSFLYKEAKIPHLVNTPGGKGGLVINWHIDWVEDWEGLEYMKENGFFTKNIKYSIHNTAGDFCNKPGDKLGFNACGKGRKYLTSIKKYGIIGSHGGWAHNWFANNIKNGVFKKEHIKKYIEKNNKCLETISGYPVIEYSAPEGVHPQPLLTRILEELGIIAYYYTGDSGSVPNRTFFNRKMISESAIAFPVLSYRESASFYEMKKTGVTAKEYRSWLFGLLDFLKNNRTIRMIYSHSYDVPTFNPDIFKEFILSADKYSETDIIRVQPMSYFAKFLKRFLKTKYIFKKEGNRFKIRLNNPVGLYDITIAVPKKLYRLPDYKAGTLKTDEDDIYYYITIKEKLNEKTLTLNIN